MTYRVGLTYHPEVGTFRPGRGAWRVLVCYQTPGMQRHGIRARPGVPRPVLFMDSPRRLQPGSWVNPRSLLVSTPAGLRSPAVRSNQ